MSVFLIIKIIYAHCRATVKIRKYGKIMFKSQLMHLFDFYCDYILI